MKLKPRFLLPEICQHLDDKKALLLLGSRRSGKTSLLYLLKLELLERKIPDSQILFFDLENQLVADQLNEIKDYNSFPLFLQSRGADTKKRTFVFLDEVQYLQRASSFIKYLVDHFPNLKFIVSGSASILVKKVFSDSMVGRVWIFPVRPLNFEEFLGFTGEKRLAQVLKKANFHLDNLGKISIATFQKSFRFYQEDFSRLFAQFCRFGGYPEAVLTGSIEGKRKILSSLYSEYIRKDIKHLEEIRQITAYNNLVRLLAGQIGQLVNESELSTSLKITRPTINRFLFLLNETFIIKMLTPYSTNPRQEIIKASKVYFEDAGLANLLNDSFQPFERNPHKGSLAENVVFSQLVKKGIDPFLRLHFWRTKQGTEVDFIVQASGGKIVPVEVKYQRFVKSKIPSGLRAFIKKYKPENALVLTKSFFSERKLGKTRVLFAPIYIIG